MVRAHIQLPDEHYTALRANAKLYERSFATEVRRAIREYLTRLDEQSVAKRTAA
jgi:predicted DNA-binding protein